MSSDGSSKSSSRAQAISTAIVVGLLLVIAGWPVFVLSALLIRYGSPMLRRGENILAVVVPLIVIGVAPHATVGGYFNWIWNLYAKGQFLTVPPLMALVTFSAFWLGVYGLVGYRFEALVPWLRRRAVMKEKSIIPTDREKQSTRIARPPTEKLLVDVDAHNIIGDVAPGPRRFPIGVDRKGRPVTLAENEIGTHGLIFGSTGSGKSETIKALAGQLLDLGWDVCVVDLKEDTQAGGLRDWCETYANSHAVPFQSLALSTPSDTWFNPLLGLSVDEARSAVLALQDFDDAYWASINKKMLGQLLTLMYRCHEVMPSRYDPPDMYRLGRIFSEPNLPKACKPMFEDLVRSGVEVNREEFSGLLNPTKAESDSATGYGAKIVQMYETEAGRTVLRPAAGRRPIDVTQSGICYVGLNSLGTPDMARVVSTAALVRLCAYAGARTTGKADASSRRAVIIDEANWVDRRQIANLLSRARSAGIAVFLATQGPLDWSEKSDSSGMGISYSVMLQNVNVVMIGVQKDFESAEVCAEIIGKAEQMQVTERVSGHWSAPGEGMIREMEDYRISPEDLRDRLAVGEMILKVFQPQSRLEWVKVHMRDPRIGPHR